MLATLLGGCTSARPDEPPHPIYGPLADKAWEASWHALEVDQSPEGGYAVFGLRLPARNVFHEDGAAAAVLEIGFLGTEGTEAVALAVRPSSETKWTTLLRTAAVTTFANETLEAPIVSQQPFSAEPAYLQVLLPPATVEADLIVAVAAIGAPTRLSVLLGAVEAVPPEPVPATTSGLLLDLLRQEGQGFVPAPTGFGAGAAIIDHAEWIYSGLFGREQGSRTYGDLEVTHLAPDPASSGAQLGPIQVVLERREASGIFLLHYVVEPTLVAYEAHGSLFGVPVEETKPLGPMASLLIDRSSDQPGGTEFRFEATRAGTASMPSVEELAIQAILLSGSLPG